MHERWSDLASGRVELDCDDGRVQTAGSDDDAPTPMVPAATVVLLRDRADRLEVLMVRRRRHLVFAGGNWVFPGGRVEDDDAIGLDPDDALGAARRAAVRETAEETGLSVEPHALVWFAHWTPPPSAPRRYATHFFAAVAPEPERDVVVDGGEIGDWAWMTPAATIEGRDRGEVVLGPPTWITLDRLRRYATTDEALVDLHATDPEHFATRIGADGPDLVALYHGDAGYEAHDPSVEGTRHRLVMADAGWRYERDGWWSPPSDRGTAPPAG